MCTQDLETADAADIGSEVLAQVTGTSVYDGWVFEPSSLGEPAPVTCNVACSGAQHGRQQLEPTAASAHSVCTHVHLPHSMRHQRNTMMSGASGCRSSHKVARVVWLMWFESMCQQSVFELPLQWPWPSHVPSRTCPPGCGNPRTSITTTT